MNPQKYPRSFSHIGITVPDIKKAVAFYEEVMGWYVIMPPSKITKENDTAIGQMCIDVFGEDWESFEIAHMSTSDGIGIELFSFPNTEDKKPEFNPIKAYYAKPTRKYAINAKCAECMGCEADEQGYGREDHLERGFRGEIRNCTAPACPLYDFRPYQGKNHAS